MRLLLILVLCLRVWHEFAFFDNSADKLLHLQEAYNWAQGNGISDCKVGFNDLSVVHYQAANWWPSGYAVAVGSLSYLLSGDVLLASKVLDAVAVVLLVLAMFFLIKRWGASDKNIWLFLIFCGLSTTPFHYLGSTGLLALTCFAWAAYFITQVIDTEDFSPSKSILIIVFLLLAASFRHAYLPMLGLPILLMGGLWILRKKANANRHLLVMSALLLIAFMAWILLRSEQALFIPDSQESDWYWANLLQLEGFGLHAFFQTNFFILKIQNWISSPIWSQSIIIFYKIISLIFTFYLLFKIKKYNKKYIYIIILSTIAINILLLTGLSLRYPPQSFNPESAWTYLGEIRYYAPAMLVIIVYIFSSENFKYLKYIALGYATLLFLGMQAAFFFSDPQHPPLERLNHQPRMQAIMAAVDFAQPAQQPVLFSSTEAPWQMASLASLQGMKPIFESDKLLNINELYTSKKCTLFFLTKGQAAKTTQNWLQNHRAKRIWEDGERRLYRIELGE